MIFATKGLFVKPIFPLALLVAALGLGGCSILEGSKVDYKSASRPTKLEVPPDLTQLSKETRYAVVNGAVSAAGSKPSDASGASGADFYDLQSNRSRKYIHVIYHTSVAAL